MALYSPVYPNNLIDTVNGILSDVGVLSNLSTNVKTSLVAAINEVNNSVGSIQSEVGSLTSLNTTDKSSVIAAINEVNGIATGAATNIGTLSSLNTTDKSSLVAAINEVYSDTSSKLEQKPDGTHDLIDNSYKITVRYLPDFILGSMLYGGVFDPTTAVATLTTNAKTKLGTSSNTITLTNDTTPITGYEANEGIFYICSGPGTFASITFSNGDWLISTGTGWNRVDTSDAVTSVEGRTGSVTIIDDTKGAGDTTYTWSADKLASIITGGVVSDVKINNVSVVTSGVANIPYASTNDGGVIRLSPSYYGTDIGTGVQEGRLTSVVYSYAGYAGISNLAFVSKGTLENVISGKALLDNKATGTDSVGIGTGVTSADNNSVAIGKDAQTSGNNGVAVGQSSKATYGSSTAVGSSAQATASAANALGTSAQATGTGSLAVGYGAKASATYAIQIGYGTNSTANTLSIGLSSSNNYRLLNSDGTIPGGRVPRSVYDRTKAITSGSIALDDGTVFYTDAPNAATTYTIDSSALTVSGLNYRYFNVLINMPSTAVGIDFTTNNTIVWAEGSTPDMSTGGRTYLLAFQTFDGGTTWIGSLCTWWATPTP